MGPRVPGPWAPGPKAPGPRVPGIRVPGPKAPGLRVPGPRVPGLRVPGPGGKPFFWIRKTELSSKNRYLLRKKQYFCQQIDVRSIFSFENQVWFVKIDSFPQESIFTHRKSFVRPKIDVRPRKSIFGFKKLKKSICSSKNRCLPLENQFCRPKIDFRHPRTDLRTYS